MRLGIARQSLGLSDLAMDTFYRALALEPKHVEAGYRAGALLETLGRRAAAVATFRHAAAAASQSNLGRLCAARALMAEDQDGAAERLAPERNQRIIKTPSKWQARQPITRPMAAPWQRFEPWLGPLAALKSS